MTFLTTPVIKISRMRKQWIPGPLPSRVGPGDEAKFQVVDMHMSCTALKKRLSKASSVIQHCM